MICSFAHKGLERFWANGDRRGIRPDHADRLRIRLSALENATSLDDIDVPGWDLHRRQGGTEPWSLKVSGAWRLLLQWGQDDHAYDLDYVQDHRGRSRR